jgi:hypothetical protein
VFALADGGGLFKMRVATGRIETGEGRGQAEVLDVVLLLIMPLFGREVTHRSFFAGLLGDREGAGSLNQPRQSRTGDQTSGGVDTLGTFRGVELARGVRITVHSHTKHRQ